jgi:hypothetical protein
MKDVLGQSLANMVIEPSTKNKSGRENHVINAESMERFLAKLSLSEISYSLEFRVVESVDCEVIKLKNRQIELLYQMKQLAKKQNSVLSQFEQNLHSNITILYGRCTSQLSFIFNAFTGNSLARILS